MNASQLMVKCLENEGVEYIFGLPGEENLDFMHALSESTQIKFVTVRHEQGAAFMADVYGRLTGKAGVCLATLGPGATNLITGLADAYLDAVSVVALTGQGSLARSHKESHQYVDIVKMFQPITKWNASVVSPNSIPELVRKAFKLSSTERMGVTHIELPEDIANQEAEAHVLPVSRIDYGHPMADDIAQARELISNAKHPLVLVGNGVIRSSAVNALRKFLQANPMPIANTYMAKGVVDNNYPLSLMTVGMLHAKDYALCAILESDLIIAIGYDLIEVPPENYNATCGKPILHINCTPAEVDSCYLPELEIVANVRETLERLSETSLVHGKDFSYPRKIREQLLSKLAEKSTSTDFPLKPQRIMSDARQVMSDTDIVISDVGSHKNWVARHYRANNPNTVIISNGLASMGIALPGAIAAKLAKPQSCVLAVMGDGGFLMNVQELETAKRLGLGFTILIFNDSGYGAIVSRQQRKYKKLFGTQFSNPDFVKLAESFGCIGHRIEHADDLLSALKKSIADTSHVHIIDCPVDYSENAALTEELSRQVCPV